MEKIRFIIVGSGWRSLYYVRIAKALPERFELCAMLCRTDEKAKKMSLENDIYATTSETECILMKPDVVVVVVNKPSISDVAMHWLDLGFCVLSETPAALEVENLEKLWERHFGGA
ncbi:MAG: Gfo/Idh/MocA family oxidoreductase, partial [Spirochaetales bacterium]|nr:Gfo/Idh/MocA family oxidoreductase [Spirochaetales bacterium]